MTLTIRKNSIKRWTGGLGLVLLLAAILGLATDAGVTRVTTRVKAMMRSE